MNAQQANRDHTPVPWHIVREPFDDGRGQWDVRDNNDRFLGTFWEEGDEYGDHPSINEAQANAQFLVKAVNSHDSLLSALEAIATANPNHRDFTWRGVVDIAQEAIAKARAVGTE